MATPGEWADEVGKLPGIQRVTAVGSRTNGTANELSDWDYAVDTVDFAATREALTELAREWHPLAAQWDPFPTDGTFMVLLPNAVKVDFIFGAHPAVTRDAWDPGRDDAQAIEVHFWDWLLWLGSKTLKGDEELVRRELDKMYVLLLRPLGASAAPRTLDEAVAEFSRWRGSVNSPAPALVGQEVMAALRRAGVVPGERS
ncbi:MAG: hypothetical protein M0R74_04080 [Dehalococcoidia bacterium]|nr:hypothetical protein [Dehalococcoidia bacterium]